MKKIIKLKLQGLNLKNLRKVLTKSLRIYLCSKGTIIDFEDAYCTGVNIYLIGAVKYIDDAHDKLDRYRNKRFNSEVINLDYDNNKKLWRL